MFPIVTVPDNAPERYESLGSKRKFWYGGGQFLFKECRQDTGEDWAETIAEYLCGRLGIPHAEYDLAEWQGQRGVITRRMHASDERLFLGNELLARIIPEYGNTTTRRGENRLHTLDSVLACLNAYPPPSGYPLPETQKTAAHAFVGYLLLDALIGNTDRHHENWGCVARDNGTDLRLAPTYDHAASLGRELQDSRREAMLETRDKRADVESYSRRGMSALYSSPLADRPMPLDVCFWSATSRFPEAAGEWGQRLAALTDQDIEYGFQQIPADRISDWGMKFGVVLVRCNRDRLLSGKPEL